MNDAVLRKQLINLLMTQQAHMGMDGALANFPLTHINTYPTGVEYTFWHLVDHVRFTQWDILDYIHNPKYKYTAWPSGYWQPKDTMTDEAGWNKSIEQFYADRNELARIVNDPKTDLYAQIPHGEPGHNVLREILVVADHNAYHAGELGILRQVMGLW